MRFLKLFYFCNIKKFQSYHFFQIFISEISEFFVNRIRINREKCIEFLVILLKINYQKSRNKTFKILNGILNKIIMLFSMNFKKIHFNY